MTSTTTTLDTFAPAHAMLDALRERRISSAELTRLHLTQIERHNSALTAIVESAPDPLRVAAEADAARGRADPRALLGLPVTLKESMNVIGMRTTVGVVDFAGFRAADDGAIARAVLGAGAVLLGKTNVAPMLADWQSANPIYGRTVNPWNPAVTPGGSTGGGAAAVAAGLSPLEFGSDIAGSIRVPAAFCGIFGHKPSETAVPRSGQFPHPSRPNAGVVLAVQGPLARSAQDLALGLSVIAGPDTGEDVAWRLELPPPRAESLAGFRVALMPTIDWLPVSGEILAGLDALASRLSRAGAKVGVAAPEAIGSDMRRHHSLYVSMLMGMTSGPLTREEREQHAAPLRASSDPWEAAHAAALDSGIVDWMGLHGRREEYRIAYREFFRDWDILLSPITLTAAWPHIDIPWPDSPPGLTIDVDGQQVPYGEQMVYPALATLSGQPATAFPIGLSTSGLPLSLQAIGPYLEDYTAIRFAGLAADAIGGYQAPPGFA